MLLPPVIFSVAWPIHQACTSHTWLCSLWWFTFITFSRLHSTKTLKLDTAPAFWKSWNSFERSRMVSFHLTSHSHSSCLLNAENLSCTRLFMFSARFPMAWSWSLLNLAVTNRRPIDEAWPKNSASFFHHLFISLLAYWAAISTWLQLMKNATSRCVRQGPTLTIKWYKLRMDMLDQ